jgi:hypothetical protein
MSLGFARDSVLDLASMAKFGDSTLSEGFPEGTPQKVGETTEVSLGFDRDSVVDLSALDKYSPATDLSSEDLDTDSDPSAPTVEDDAPHDGQYSGFSVQYAEYEKANEMSYDVDPYAPTIFGGSRQDGGSDFWCCLFPWMPPKTLQDTERQVQVEDKSPNRRPMLRSNGGEEDDVSTGSSDVYGEKLTDKDRLAVLARLRISAPDPTDTTTQKLLNGSLPKESCRKARGILKRGSTQSNPAAAAKIAKAVSMNSGSDDGTQKRRSLFPQYEEKKSSLSEVREKHNVKFSPMARVVTVKSRADMTYLEKSGVWWQKQDYEDFKKTGRIIAKAMLEGGSEVWLAMNKSWQIKPKIKPGGSPQPRAYHMSERTQIVRDQLPGQVSSEGNKWWNQFGHSRRGLEHIASIDEGRQRQSNVRIAIRMVIDEQRRQKTYGKPDAEKLRTISMQYTGWARDLALSAAESDTEAVRSNFSEKAKTREYYLLKRGIANAHSTNAKQMPAFMMPVGVSPQMLDAHTSTQIRYRRTQSPHIATRKVESSKAEPIHDPPDGKSNMAKQAAGYGVSETDMSKVLSGMGVNATQAGDSTNSIALPAQTSVGAH